MMRLLKSTLFVGFVFGAFAFTPVASKSVVGVYGVCDDNPSQVRLELKSDNTFEYIDNSVTPKLNVSGNWELTNEHVVLLSSQQGAIFHRKWKISEDWEVAKARKGMTFYTLRRQGE
ncbi:MAG: hypothetical protein GC193_02525 [Cryomorphaceae bacterium]|nr:hypothetical protein [Cryomorphaceae bacterium]